MFIDSRQTDASPRLIVPFVNGTTPPQPAPIAPTPTLHALDELKTEPASTDAFRDLSFMQRMQAPITFELPRGRLECHGAEILRVREAGKLRVLTGADLHHLDACRLTIEPWLRTAIVQEAIRNTDLAGRTNLPPGWVKDGKTLRLLTEDMGAEDFARTWAPLLPTILLQTTQRRCAWVAALAGGPHDLADFIRAIGLVEPRLCRATRDLLRLLLRDGHFDLARLILAGLRDVKKQRMLDESLLYASICDGSPEAVSVLLEASPHFGQQAFSAAACLRPGQSTKDLWLRTQRRAAANNRPDVLRAMHAAGVLRYSDPGFVQAAMKARNVPMLEEMHRLAVAARKQDWLAAHPHGGLLPRAVFRADIPMVDYLGSRGASANCLLFGMTALQIATEQGNPEMIEALLQCKAAAGRRTARF